MANQYGKDFDVEEIKKIYIKNGYIPMFNSYKNAHEKLPCINKDGYKVLLSYDKLTQGRNPQPFYKNNPYTIENIKLFIVKNKRKDILVSTTFSEANSKGLNFICGNGHQYTMLWRHFKNGSGCPHCANYKGEQKIRKFLESSNIEFKFQKTYDDLFGVSNKRKLSYDFYIPQYNLLIEYQGEQHERPIEIFGGESNYIKQIKHDNIKRNYAISNKINLLEIWYYNFNNIEKIIKEYVNATTYSFSV